MAVSRWTWKINYETWVLWGIAHTYITYYIHCTLLCLPLDFRVAYAANISKHQMRERTPHRELHHLLFLNIKELLVMQGQYSFQTSPKSLFHSRVHCHICKWNSINLFSQKLSCLMFVGMHCFFLDNFSFYYNCKLAPMSVLQVFSLINKDLIK